MLLLLLLLSPLLVGACKTNLDCGAGHCVQRFADGAVVYGCECPAGYEGERCEQLVEIKRSAEETPPCPCESEEECSIASGDDREGSDPTEIPCTSKPRDGQFT